MKTLTNRASINFTVVITALMALICALFLSCSNKPSQGGDRVSTKIEISIPKSSLVDQIDIIRLQVIFEDEIVDSRETQLTNGSFDFGTFSVPTGEVTFVAEAVELPLDGGLERILYANTVTILVEAGDNVAVPLTLLPAAPMVKLAPYFGEAAAQTIYTVTLEIWNVSTFNNGFFRIAFDPELFEFDGATQANDFWGGLDILAEFGDGEVVLDIDRPSGLETIPLTPELARLRFNALDVGTTTLDLTVEAFSDNDGIVPEFVSGSLYEDDATVLIVASAPLGALSGTVRNATDNSPILSALVTITGPVVSETNTNSLGEFNFANLPFGTYQLEVIAEGYITRTFTQIVDEAEETAHISLSPPLGEGQYRIVLTWSELPPDLDAHFYTIVDAIIYEVYFIDPGLEDQLPYAVLDVDDVTGLGPETVTVYEQFGPIVFAVHNFSQYSENPGGDPATRFANSRARVDLYQGDRLIRTFDASRSATQQWWHVFEISANGELIVVDRYSDGPPDFAFSVGTTIPEKTAK